MEALNKIIISFLLLISTVSYSETHPDPFEDLNRDVLEYNMVSDKAFFSIVAHNYNEFTPSPVRAVIRNFFNNVSDATSIPNQILQGEIEGAMINLIRVGLNSTLGLGGLVDIAKQMDIKGEKEDFGQTLAFYGVESGPFLVLPVVGPTTARDLFGKAVDFVSPFNILTAVTNAERIVLETSGIIDTRWRVNNVIEALQDMDEDDRYDYVKSMYEQRRTFEIEGENGGSDDPFGCE